MSLKSHAYTWGATIPLEPLTSFRPNIEQTQLARFFTSQNVYARDGCLARKEKGVRVAL